MKAMLCEKFGPPKNLALKEVADLTPLEGQVRIATEACGVISWVGCTSGTSSGTLQAAKMISKAMEISLMAIG